MKAISPAQKLRELPVGSIVAKRGAENVFCRLATGWVTLADPEAESSYDVAGERFAILRHGHYGRGVNTLAPTLPEE